MKEKIIAIYELLYDAYGPQGWWPLVRNDTEEKEDIRVVYHPKDYSTPHSVKDQFSILVGCVLTQNTSWKQVEKALQAMERLDILEPEKLQRSSEELVKNAIRYAGYYNQKYATLKRVTELYLEKGKTTPTREELLSLKGVGPETADSILLYAYGEPEFVIDSYTKRITHHLKLTEKNAKYDTVKALFESSLDTDPKIYNEFHALIVKHAKVAYSKEPFYDPLLEDNI